MDISDILYSVSDPSPSVQSVDLQALTRAWVNERVAPEVLPYPVDLIERVMRGLARLANLVVRSELANSCGTPGSCRKKHKDFDETTDTAVGPRPRSRLRRLIDVRRQIEQVEEQTATMDPKTNFRVVIMQTELERWKFLVRSFLRARIAKIDRHILHYLTPTYRHLLSSSEIQYATKHQNLLHAHYHASFLAQFPAGLQKLDDTAGGIAMVEVPDVERTVFVRGVREAPIRVSVDGTDMDFEIKRGEVVVVRWSAVKEAVMGGGLECV